MPKQNHVRGLLFVLALWGCDSTVGLDAQSVKITELLVPNACALADDGSQLELSILMFNQNETIGPKTWLVREAKTVAELFSCDESYQTCTGSSQFEFKKPGAVKFDQFTEPAGVEGQNTGLVKGLALRIDNLRYEYSGGEGRKNNPNLLMLLVDHSGSLVGENPLTGDFTSVPATDKSGDRIGFFRSLISNMPTDTFFSLIWFNKDFPVVQAEFATPTLNREQISGLGIDNINRAASGLTPLADALLDAKQQIIDANRNLNPLIVLFTDGVETGDSSTRSSLEEMTAAYANDPNGPIPIIVMELQPPANSPYRLQTGRDPALVNLACRTGGEYIFLETPAEMTSAYQRLENVIRARLSGSWRMNVTTTLSSPDYGSDNYYISTDLLVNVGGTKLPTTLTKQREDGGDDYEDARLWVQKQ
ncbi:VWA domain-containing protein [Myxococcota bacterium]|nr:VWA domain-containing protein [Myxococcota bacterium]MBU1429224.1 VWA domain-containing protein [Myxococcota bacterium]MBU1899177.1 VWA domain-containing protein [Myxococcota bacterium]